MDPMARPEEEGAAALDVEQMDEESDDAGERGADVKECSVSLGERLKGSLTLSPGEDESRPGPSGAAEASGSVPNKGAAGRCDPVEAEPAPVEAVAAAEEEDNRDWEMSLQELIAWHIQQNDELELRMLEENPEYLRRFADRWYDSCQFCKHCGKKIASCSKSGES